MKEEMNPYDLAQMRKMGNARKILREPAMNEQHDTPPTCRLCKGKGRVTGVDAINANGSVVNPRSEECMVCRGKGVATPDSKSSESGTQGARDPFGPEQKWIDLLDAICETYGITQAHRKNIERTAENVASYSNAELEKVLIENGCDYGNPASELRKLFGELAKWQDKHLAAESRLAAVEKERDTWKRNFNLAADGQDELRDVIGNAYSQMKYIEKMGCPCGARGEDLEGWPHVLGCGVAALIHSSDTATGKGTPRNADAKTEPNAQMVRYEGLIQKLAVKGGNLISWIQHTVPEWTPEVEKALNELHDAITEARSLKEKP